MSGCIFQRKYLTESALENSERGSTMNRKTSNICVTSPCTIQLSYSYSTLFVFECSRWVHKSAGQYIRGNVAIYAIFGIAKAEIFERFQNIIGFSIAFNENSVENTIKKCSMRNQMLCKRDGIWVDVFWLEEFSRFLRGNFDGAELQSDPLGVQLYGKQTCGCAAEKQSNIGRSYALPGS